MTRDEIYRAWAPQERAWSTWVKPVLFAHVDNAALAPDAATPEHIDVSWVPAADGSTAIIVDLPGEVGIWTALALAPRGYTPVPLYNAIPTPRIPEVSNDSIVAISGTVPVWPIVRALTRAAQILERLQFAVDAPPTFLLDANRAFGSAKPSPGGFDNRSISLPTDFPSANLLLSRGIRRAVLIQETSIQPQPDLAHTLLRWQTAGIQILARRLADAEPLQAIQISRPNSFRLFWYNFLATFGLKRSPFGGFGGRLPMSASGG
jgi:hypothetical protein